MKNNRDSKISNDCNKKKGDKEAGYTAIDNRLMVKQDITIHQKVLLSQVVSMMKNTNKYYASNDYITATTGFNKKTIGKAFKVFHERGWLYHQVIPGGGRKVYFNSKHETNLNKYLGTVEKYKIFLKSIKKSYELDDMPNKALHQLESLPTKLDPSAKLQEKKVDNIPPIAPSQNVNKTLQLTSISDPDEEIPDDFVIPGDQFSFNVGNVESATKFGEPDTLEYCFCDTWFPINKSINEEIKILRKHNEGLTVDIVKRACEGEAVDTGEFQFRFIQKLIA